MVILEKNSTFIPLHKYLVEVEGLRRVYAEGSVKKLLVESEIYNRTKGLVTEGVVAEVPLSVQSQKLKGKKVRFLYTEADATIEGKYPQIADHLQVYPDNIQAFYGDKGWQTVGDWISMDKVERNKTRTGLIIPGIKRISNDTARGEDMEYQEYYMDKGIVNMPNDHFPVGTWVFFEKPEFAHHSWPDGMLIRRRRILAWGPDVKRMIWMKPIKR